MEKTKQTGHIIELIGDEFLEKFIHQEDVMDYQYLLLSTDIRTSKEFKNVMEFPRLIPDGCILEFYMSKEKKQYKHEYKNFLMRDEIRAFITVMMKSVVCNGFKLVLLCSEEESEYKFIKMIRQFIEEEYDFPTYTYKKYCKARDNDDFVPIKDLAGIEKQIDKEVKRIEKLQIQIGEEDKVEKAMKALDKMGKKEMRAFCKQKGYKKKKYEDLDKEQLKAFIIKKMQKEAN